jgi:hypothetical protein
MRPPDPESRRAASLRESDPVSGETRGTLSQPLFPVKPRLCKPMAAAALAREIRDRLLVKLETGSDFARRVARIREDAERKDAQ